ncbi:hypothetical protein DPMN_167016 [Dreissena polymorpha]|uniref:Uncharacterized protein n=1 Tax=Dreissena polymorpha TaxID=45954 RepID=A0A9D4IXX3_DREPO|nr:hypothetical protein DPMN_167016 [Dreissena polymorpha]
MLSRFEPSVKHKRNFNKSTFRKVEIQIENKKQHLPSGVVVGAVVVVSVVVVVGVVVVVAVVVVVVVVVVVDLNNKYEGYNYVDNSTLSNWVRFNESDHGRVTMVVPANNRRATITGFNGERRLSVDCALFDILSSDRSPPLKPRLLVA